MEFFFCYNSNSKLMHIAIIGEVGTAGICAAKHAIAQSDVR